MSDRSGEPPPADVLRGSALVAFLAGLFRALPGRSELVAAVRNSTVATLVRGSALVSALAGLRPPAERTDRSADDDRTRRADPAEAPPDDDGVAAPDSPTTPGTAEAGGLLAGSMLARAGSWFRRLVTRSWLYRWLTAEPDPDVVVIDLRKTWTAGPILAVLDRLVGFAVGAFPASRIGRAARGSLRLARARPVQVLSTLVGSLALLLAARTVLSGSPSVALFAVVAVLAALGVIGSRVTWSWARVRESRGFRALAAAFEPPEPPGEHERDRSKRGESDEPSAEQ